MDTLVAKSVVFRCYCDEVNREHEIFQNPKTIETRTVFSTFDTKEYHYDRGVVDEIHFMNCEFRTLKRNVFETFYNAHTFGISDVDLETLDVNMFQAARSVTKLDISRNKLKELPSHLFAEAVKLKEVDFSANCITQIHPLAFEGATELQELNLSLNRLTDLDAHTFTMPKLLVLDLSNNNITTLNENIFDKLGKLKTLILSFNALVLGHLQPSTFANLFELEELSLRRTNLSNILPDTFLHQSKLISLDLSENKLAKFDHRLFDPVRLNLKSLRLSKNQLSDLDGLQSTVYPQITLLDIQGNLFNCSYLQHMMKSFSVRRKTIRFHDKTTLIDVHKSYIRGVDCNPAPEETTSDSTTTTFTEDICENTSDITTTTSTEDLIFELLEKFMEIPNV